LAASGGKRGDGELGEWPALPKKGETRTRSSTQTFRSAWRTLLDGASLINVDRLHRAFRLGREGRYDLIASALRDLLSVQSAASWAPRAKPFEEFAPTPLPEDHPLVSVIIPCFNYGEFILEAVDSILAQTLTSLEVIIVDGGSTDERTRQILHELRRPMTRVILREGRHLVGSNRNCGIATASGRYICCLDADDQLRPTFLEKATFLLETYAYDVVSTAVEFIGARQGTSYHVATYPCLDNLVRANHVCTCAVFRRELWVLAGGFDDYGLGKDHAAEDWDFWMRLAVLGARFRNISREALLRYRTHVQGSLSSNAEVPPQDEQRRRISARNSALLGREAFARSRAQQERRLRIPPSLTVLASRPNLVAAHDQGPVAPTILVMLPFLILGGAERLLSEVLQYLHEQGWRVIIVSTRNVPQSSGDTVAWFSTFTAEIYALPAFLEQSEWLDFVEYILRNRKVDLILNVGSKFFYETVQGLSSLVPNVAIADLLFNTQGHGPDHELKKSKFDGVLCENEEVKRWLESIGWAPEKITIIHSGIDLQRFSPEPKVSGKLAAADQGDLVVGFCGRWSEEKGPDVFVDMAGRCAGVPQLRFIMTGTGPLESQIKRQIRKLPSGVRFDCRGDVKDIIEVIRLCDIIVLPSRIDGRPMIVMEALACGVPVLASCVGGIPDLIVEGKTGMLCAPADAQDFVRKLTQLAADRSAIFAMKRAARDYAATELDGVRMVRSYEKALLQLIEAKTSADCQTSVGAPGAG
jgi:glycosyltransferase involved in cell wall biosynthesis